MFVRNFQFFILNGVSYLVWWKCFGYRFASSSACCISQEKVYSLNQAFALLFSLRESGMNAVNALKRNEADLKHNLYIILAPREL